MRSLSASPAPEPPFACRIARMLVLAISIVGIPVIAAAQVPDVTQSYYVPQTGPVATPTEGTAAIALFRVCPNNEGGTSLPNHARIKIVLRDESNNPIPGVPASEIYLLFNGGTVEQGFTGSGADSIVANSTFNPSPACPDVRMIPADASTDAFGVTYITFAGSTPGSPGVATRDPNRKWGHFDSSIPVYARGVQLGGRLTSASANYSYVLRIKNVDSQEGLGVFQNEGAAVTLADLMCVLGESGRSSVMTYWVDFNYSGTVTAVDVNLVLAHLLHDCDTPLNP